MPAKSEVSMFSTPIVMSQKIETKHRTLFVSLVLVLSIFSVQAAAQADQPNLLPGNDAPLVVTPEVHLSAPALPVGASNATAGNNAGATNATVGGPRMAKNPGAVLQYSGPAYSVTITPNPATLQGAAPSTPEVHLGTAIPQVGAANATAGNTAGAVNATASLLPVPKANSTVPEYTVRGSTITIIPPPQAIPSAPSTNAEEGPTSTDRK
jgi:hypothetical protein